MVNGPRLTTSASGTRSRERRKGREARGSSRGQEQQGQGFWGREGRKVREIRGKERCNGRVRFGDEMPKEPWQPSKAVRVAVAPEGGRRCAIVASTSPGRKVIISNRAGAAHLYQAAQAILVGVSGPLSSAAALPRGVGIGFGDERGIDGGIRRLLCLGLLGGPRSSAPLSATFTGGGGAQGWGRLAASASNRSLEDVPRRRIARLRKTCAS